MNIRKIEIKDAKKYLCMLQRLDNETKYMMFEPGERKTTEEEMIKRIEDTIKSGSLKLVAEEGERIVGFLGANKGAANRIKHRAYIVIGILKDYRGRGIGKQLFQKLDKWALENSISRLELTVMIHNESAVALYKKMGFKVEGIKEKSLLVDGEFVDEYYMAKLL